MITVAFGSGAAKSGAALGLCGSDCYLASCSLEQSDAYNLHILQGSILSLPLHSFLAPADSPRPLSL